MLQEIPTDPRLLPLESVFVQEGFNPRTYFNEAKFARLVSSIRANTLITPITVRPVEDGRFAIIAGERRYRAMRLLGETDIPALVIECDEDQARRMALLENIDRDDLSVGEESNAALRHVDAYDGDHEAAAAALGWTVQKLRHRLQLQHASPAVLDALMTETISLGIAELICTLPVETQDKLLPRVIEQGVTIQALREQLEGFSLPLDKGIFDKTECQGCPHNSGGAQQELFSAHIAEGRCTNKPCFTAKTQVALDAKRELLREDYATLAYSTEKVPGSTIPLVMLGPAGVGSEQFAACRSCEFRGAVIEARVGNQTGQVDGPLCFNRPCNTRMVEAYQQTLAPATTATTPDADAVPEQDEGEETAAPAGNGVAARVKKAPSKAARAGKPAARSTPEAVNVLYDTAMRGAVVAHMQADLRWTLALAVYGLARLGSTELHSADTSGLLKGAGLSVSKQGGMAGGDTGIVAALAATETPLLRQALVALSSTFIGHDGGNAAFNQHRVNRRQLAARLATAGALDVAPHVRVDQAFLAAHTRAGIEAVMDESGLTKWLCEQPDGAKKHKALLASGKADLITGVLAVGFDFTGYIPTGLVELRKQLVKGK